MILGLTLLIVLSAFIGVPLLAVLGLLPAFLFHSVADVPIQAMITQVKLIMEAPGLIALPIFTFMGYILNYGKTSERMANLAERCLGWIPGGLAITMVVTYTAFCAITGGSALSVMTLGGIYFVALMGSGYSKKFSLGICTVCGGAGMLFPPSLPVIIIGFISYQSIDKLYIGALLPGLTVVGIYLLYVIWYSSKEKIVSKETFSFGKAFEAFLDFALELPLPFIIIGGIFSGWMTVMEVSVVSLLYVIIVECFIRREVGLKDFKNASLDSMLLVGAIFAILTSALTLSNFLIDFRVPQSVLEFVQGYISSRIVFLLVLNVILLITGCLMEVFSAILVMVPLLLPVATGYGIDPLHFAVIFLWNLEIGYSTPPIGFNLFIASFRFKQPMPTLWRAAVPPLFVEITGLIFITYLPELTLWLPRVLGMTKELINFSS